jgi:hypothetical protein
VLSAHLPLDAELVLTCAICGEPSTADVRGTDGWRVVRAIPGRRRLIDVCPRCPAAAPLAQVTGHRGRQ